MSDRPSIDPGFSTSGIESVFSAESTVSAILEFEAGLALSLADVGIAPETEATELARACADPVDDVDAVLASTWEAGTPILALRRKIEQRVDAQAARWFHHGATSQDAIDTGLMLQARRGLETIDSDLLAIARTLVALTERFRDQFQMGRTFLQDAEPTTFGLRTAGWLDATLDHHEDMQNQALNLPVQLGGSNGTRSTYGDHAGDLVDALAKRLTLAPSPVVWHTNRNVIRSLVHLLERTATTMAKVATDVALLSSSAIGEIRVRSGGSSSMQGKENPIDSIRAVAAAVACNGAGAMLNAAPPSQLDRGVGAWHVEWVAVPLAFRTAAAAVEAMKVCLASVEVDTEPMSANVSGEVDASAISAQIDTVLERAND